MEIPRPKFELTASDIREGELKMKTFAYPEMYRDIAADNLGIMFDYGINYCHISPNQLFNLFIESDCANQFENGSPRVIVGMFGTELCRDVLYRTQKIWPEIEYPVTISRTPEYWAGWIMAQYQWYSCQSFETIMLISKLMTLFNYIIHFMKHTNTSLSAPLIMYFNHEGFLYTTQLTRTMRSLQ